MRLILSREYSELYYQYILSHRIENVAAAAAVAAVVRVSEVVDNQLVVPFEQAVFALSGAVRSDVTVDRIFETLAPVGPVVTSESWTG